MTPCEILSGKLFAYLDGSYGRASCTNSNRIFRGWVSCQVAVAGRRRFLNAISRARPELSTPPELRRRVQGILTASAPQTIQKAKPMPGLLERTLAALALSDR